jgi:ABC-type amino acid transport substrate-binding protein
MTRSETDQTTAIILPILTVGLDDAPPMPMQIGTPEEGNFRGYEVDLLEEIARRLGVQLRYRRAFWSVIVDELAGGDIDMICSAATVTEERRRQADFCDPHLELTLGVVTREGAANIGVDFAGLRVGLRRGTTAEKFARAHGVSRPAILSDSNDNIYSALAADRLDAVIDDSPIAEHFARVFPGLRYAGALPGTQGAYAIMVRKGNTRLVTAINAALAEMERDGVLAVLRAGWFNSETAA